MEKWINYKIKSDVVVPRKTTKARKIVNQRQREAKELEMDVVDYFEKNK